MLKCFGGLMRGLVLWILLGWAAGAHAVPLLVDFHGSEPEVVLGRNAQILEDADGRLTLPAVLNGVYGWTPYHADTFNFGFSKSVWWVRLRLRNADAKAVDRVLDIGSALQDEVDVYVVRGAVDGEVDAVPTNVEHVATGDRRPFAARPVDTRVPSLPIHFSAGEQIDVYVRLAAHDGLHEAVALKLWQPRAYAKSEQAENLLFGLYYGALGTVWAYNLFLFISTRQRSFGLYVVYVSAFLFWSFTFRGYAFQYLWPDAPVFNNQILPIAATACYATFTAFMMSYLDTWRSLPRWLNHTFIGAVVGIALGASPALFNYYAWSFAASSPFGVVLMLSAFASGLMLLRRGSRPARYFLISFAALTVGVLLYYLRVLGAVPSNVITENFLQIGSVAEVLLLAFGLADQMNQLKAGKLRAEREALAAQIALATELESLVQRRTRALESANQRLLDSALTDDLTGVYNRRHFDSVLDAEVARHARNAAPMALCLFNLDGFSAYNRDRGAAAGDAALQQVAQVVSHRLRRAGDQLFRVEGDQFALLINLGPSEPDCLAFVDSIRSDIEALQIARASVDAGDASDVLTARFGLLVLGSAAPALRAVEVYDATAVLLAQAKQQGGNLVCGRVWADVADRTRLRVVGARGDD